MRAVDLPGMLPDGADDAEMAALALVQAPQTFKTTDMFRGVVFVTTPQNTWIERTKNDLSVALTEGLLPIAANLATLALGEFNRRYPEVIDASLPSNSQPGTYRRLPTFLRDLRQLGKFNKFAAHLRNENKKRGFVGAMMSQTEDLDFVKNSVRKVDTLCWFYKDGIYNIDTDTFRAYTPEDNVLADSTITVDFPTGPPDEEVQRAVATYMSDFTVGVPELLKTFKDFLTVSLMDSVAFKQFYLVIGPPDGGKV